MQPPTDADFLVEEFRTASKVEVRSRVDPISLQADPTRKRALQGALGRSVKNATTGIYTHDVEVTLIWFIKESRRYQTHLVADLDNVVKPILDAVTGPDGLLVDDNQVQSFRVMWMTPGALGTGFQLTFESLSPDDYVTRAGISFVEFSADRCYLLPGGFGEHAPRMVSAYRRMLATYHDLVSAGVEDDRARIVLPITRPFPRARLGRFEVRHEREFAGID
ncbi:RusA family crossover junction endodeoxyribonuclease [Oerskovia sp. KBS0722]|uniref:RusA family crossover junction endodeoxyribonuclease n=1 Tax=Oerskovia sp. KBS0722 TaxID=1179673 RepID=UPI00110E0BF4|nr:RusA family crossover junction endodeoxyribonuclease [Oerskovia sp. KBS0722]QDW61720.1 RusA family crossover junction endodeoxyribonuclease [Oerskovia sp. KBS0722]